MHSKTTIPTNKPNTASHESTQFQGLIPWKIGNTPKTTLIGRLSNTCPAAQTQDTQLTIKEKTEPRPGPPQSNPTSTPLIQVKNLKSPHHCGMHQKTPHHETKHQQHLHAN
eukprot:gene3442-2393_t